MSIKPETIVTDAELGALAGVSARRIRALVETGDLERVAPGRFALGPSIKILIDLAAGSGSELQRERTRATKATADLRELEYSKARAEVAPIADFERAMAAMCGQIQINVMNVPQRVVTQLLGETDEATFKAKLKAELTLALTATANAKLTMEDVAEA